MALLNHVFENSYTVVGDVTYNSGSVTCCLYVFTDATKTTLAFRREIAFQNQPLPSVKYIFVSDIPEDAQIGDSWLTAHGYTDFHGHTPDQHLIVKKTGDDDYLYVPATPFFNEVSGQYQSASDGVLTPFDPWSCSVLFDRYFSQQDDVNIVRQIYLYLQNHISDFKNCVNG